jgi:pimeloyl-ACP methyl ester carboxylesterase
MAMGGATEIGRQPSSHAGLPPDIRRRFVDIPGGQVHLRCARENAHDVPLVMLHASPGSSKMVEPLMRAFAGSRPVFAPDTLGNGDSTPRDDPDPPLETFVDAHIAALDGLGLDCVDLYGTRTGGNIACEIAIRHPARVRRVILDGISLCAESERNEILQRYAPALNLSEDGSHLLWIWSFVRDAYLFWPWYKRDTAHVRGVGLPSAEALHDKFVEVAKAARSYHLSYRAAITYRKEDRLKLVRVPTLLCCARSDMLLAYFDQVAALMPGAQRLVTAGYGDADAMTETVAAMRSFLDAAPVRA